jgi:streptogramin lyase
VVVLVAAVTLPTRADGKFTDLGVQITSSTVIGTTFGKDGAGHDVVYTVMRGHPAKLLSFDLATGQLQQSLPLDGADGAWNACTATDGSIYVGTDSNGHLYRYIPGENAVHDLGNPLPGQTWVWDVTAGKDGEVFGGTYPGACVFRYHPRDGFSDVGKGAVAEGEKYVRCVAADPERGVVYAGVGSHAHLIRIDLKTGEKRDILPKEYADQEFVYGLDRFDDRLVALISRMGKSLIFDTKTNEVLGIIPAMGGQQIMTVSPDDGNVYYTNGGQLQRFSLNPRAHQTPEKLAPCPDALAFAWIDHKLVGFTRNGIFSFDRDSNELTRRAVKMPDEPTDIQSIELGPDGRIWTGGYLSGGNAAFDPETGKSEQYKGLSQSEDMTVVGKKIYFGIYPGARLSLYDTTKPWDPKKNNPLQFGNLGSENQSRPMAMCGVEELNKVFIGTIPEYGQNGGVLAVYDIAAGKLTAHHDVVPKQSISSLVYHDHQIIGGSSIFGGLGQEPEAKEASLFIWDPALDKKVFDMVPVPAARAITGLFVGPDGNIWGMAEETLFIFYPKERKVISTHTLFDTKDRPHHIWRDAFFAIHPDGQIYGTARNCLFSLDPATKKITILRDKGAGLLSMDRAGRLYFRETTHLWQYVP